MTGLAIGTDGERIVSCGCDGVAVLWDLASHAKLTNVPVFGPEGVALLADGQAAVAAAGSLSVCVCGTSPMPSSWTRVSWEAR